MSGKRTRLAQLFRADGRSVVVALDHGQFVGPVGGLVDPLPALQAAVAEQTDGVILNPGLAQHYTEVYGGRIPLILRVTGAMTHRTRRFDYHRRIASVESAVALGADAVIVMGFVGGEGEPQSLELVASIAEECRRFGMPLFAEMLPADPALAHDPEWVSLAARVGAELGADVIKTYFTGSDSFKNVTRGCPVPILVAGGPKTESPLTLAEQAIRDGAAGIAFGRNVFEHDTPRAQIRRLIQVVHSMEVVSDG